MNERAEGPRKSSHPGPKPLAGFVLCLVFGPLGLLYFGAIDTVIVGSIYLAGLGAFYWIWAAMLPEFIGFSLVLLAFAAKYWAALPPGTSSNRDLRHSLVRVWPLAARVMIDMGLLCIAGAFLKQIWMGFGKIHILGIFLSLCISLPIGFLLVQALRDNILRRVSR